MNNKFKIVHVIHSPCGGGAELLVRELTKRTNELGINCKAVYFNCWPKCAKTIELSEDEQSLNINTRNPYAIIKLRKLFKTELIKHSGLIIHAHLTWPMFFVSLASIGLKVKLVFTQHNIVSSVRNFSYFKYFERFFYNRFNSIIAISKGVKDSLSNWLGASIFKKVINIPNGARFFSYKERLSIDKSIKFISVGSLRYQKNFDIAIKALSHLKNIDWHYEIIGTGPLKTQLEKLIYSLGLQDKVTLSGWCSNLERKYHNADIQLLPSRFEGFGLIAVEGMSTGLPVIASDVPGLNEVVSDSIESCFLVKDINNIDAWVDQIKLCINALEKNLPHISKESYQHSQKFSLGKMTKNYIDLYKELIIN